MQIKTVFRLRTVNGKEKGIDKRFLKKGKKNKRIKSEKTVDN